MNRRRIVSLTAVAVTAILATPIPALATGPQAGGDAQVVIEGIVEQLADAPTDEGSAVRLSDGRRLPLRDAVGITRGDRVRVTVPVPDEVVDDVMAGEAVSGGDGPVEISRRELRRATTTPAPARSELADATVEHAVAEGASVAPTGVTMLAHAQKVAPAATAATHDVTVAIVVPKGVKGAVPTMAQVTAQLRGADAYWRQQSRGTLGLRLASVTTPYASAFSCDDNAFSMWTEAARATGFVEGPSKHLVMVLPRSAGDAGCSYGLASMGEGVSSGGLAYVADTAWPVLAHEIGHNFGLAHAKALRCRSVTDTNLARPGSGCRIEEYGDPFDVMSASAQDAAGSLSLPQAARLGFAAAGDYVDVTGSRTVTLDSVSSLTGVRGARVRDPRNGAIYWVEYRTRTGRDARLYLPMTAGVRVLREEAATRAEPWAASIALDASPTGRDDDVAWTLPAGTRFTSYGGGVGVSVLALRGERASVTITLTGAGRGLAGARAGLVTPIRAAAPRTAAVRPATPSVTISTRGIVSWRSTARGPVRYDAVVRRVVGRSTGREQTWYARTTRTSAPLRAARGVTVQVRVRARSGSSVGSWSPWRAATFR
ncbi:reprolysin-like metallopeptidase [Mobilicoccus massiliensis]|uniref:reprolysin-like metallopeptidase n=1 Tax=Mobilicoccus massiliensis TaxID=1522310 RepID=UPI001141A675|nr:zinc-dependent metalloprotease family protein [Mobilicoccus massiliensis]